MSRGPGSAGDARRPAARDPPAASGRSRGTDDGDGSSAVPNDPPPRSLRKRFEEAGPLWFTGATCALVGTVLRVTSPRVGAGPIEVWTLFFALGIVAAVGAGVSMLVEEDDDEEIVEDGPRPAPRAAPAAVARPRPEARVGRPAPVAGAAPAAAPSPPATRPPPRPRPEPAPVRREVWDEDDVEPSAGADPEAFPDPLPEPFPTSLVEILHDLDRLREDLDGTRLRRTAPRSVPLA